MLLAASAVALGTVACSGGGATPKTADDSTSFAIGFGAASQLASQLSAAKQSGMNIDSAALIKGYQDGLQIDSAKYWYYVGVMQGAQVGLGTKSDSTIKSALVVAGAKAALKLDSASRAKEMEKYNLVMQRAQEERMKKQEAEQEKQMEKQYGANKAKGAAYIEQFKKEAGVQTTASGLAYKVLTPGSGATPKATDEVTVRYKGTLIDGKVFDETKDSPATFPVTGVIKGWTEMLQLMKVGEKVKVVIPQDLAYGGRYMGEDIPPFSTLVFEIELVKVGSTAAADSTAK